MQFLTSLVSLFLNMSVICENVSPFLHISLFYFSLLCISSSRTKTFTFYLFAVLNLYEVFIVPCLLFLLLVFNLLYDSFSVFLIQYFSGSKSSSRVCYRFPFPFYSSVSSFPFNNICIRLLYIRICYFASVFIVLLSYVNSSSCLS